MSFASPASITSLLVCSLIICLPARAEDVLPGNPAKAQEANEGSAPSSTGGDGVEPEVENASTTLRVGADLYYGRSNLKGAKRLRDGFWSTGEGLVDPSTVHLGLKTRSGSEGKIAFGVGRLYTDKEKALEQPHEAWYRTFISGLDVTIGKFYVPFALQEWQYETRWGLMIEGDHGKSTWAASLNYNQVTNKPNGYLRVGRDFSEKLNVGASIGLGEGLSYGSTHNRAAGLDISASARGWNLYGEYVWMKAPDNDKFNFRWAKLEYEKLGKLKPFISHWRWSDSSDNFGEFRSNTLGASYEIRPALAIEGGFSRTSESDVKWLQLHWTPEWTLWNKSQRSSQDKTQAALLPGISQQILSR